MNYKATGGPKGAKNTPNHAEHNAHGSRKKPFGAKDDKAALLARMKAAVADKKT